MGTYTRKLLTIVTEAAIEGAIRRDLTQLGARGYTITDARGRGDRGVRNASWETSGNIRIEVVCSSDTAAKISAHLEQHYYTHYAMIMYLADVEVLRSEKF